MSRTRSRLVGLAVATVTGGALLAVPSTAVGAPAPAAKAARPIDVTLTTDAGFTMPATVRAGLVTFRVGSPESTYHALQGFALKNGAAVDDVVTDLSMGVSGDPVQAAQGARNLLQHSTLIGGVVTTSYAPMSVTVLMMPGTYYFFDLNDIFLGVTPRVHTVRAVGLPSLSGFPRADAVILLQTMSHQGMPDHHSISVSSTSLSRTGTFLIVNTADEVHESVFRQVIPGTTDQYLNDYYDAIVNGTPRPPRPWLSDQWGLQAISPGVFAFLHIDLPAANYAVICFVPSADDGLPHAYMGMHKIVTVG